jgi:TorA-specific chaperone
MRFLSTVETSDAGDLAIDYARLFLGATSGSVCPSESSYREDRLFGECTGQVRQFYSRCGFVIDDSFTEPDDHIAVEYYFMSLLARSTLAICNGRNRDSASFRDHIEFQLLFLQEHLSRWIGRWATEVQKLSVTDFFKVLAHLALVIVTSDLDFLAEIMEAYGFRR